MNTLERRLKRLEGGKVSDETQFVHWKWNADKLKGLRCNRDGICERLPDEPYEDFMQRALKTFAETMKLGAVAWLDQKYEGSEATTRGFRKGVKA